MSKKNVEVVEHQCKVLQDILAASDEQYQAVLSALQKNIPSTSEDYIQNAFDFVIIDADHSYEGSILDFKNTGQYAKNI